MSKYDYEQSRALVAQDPTFASLIMAAARRADSDNIARLYAAFPEIVTELRERYNAPGGLLAGEVSS